MIARIIRRFKLNKISAVDRPAQGHARVVIMKNYSSEKGLQKMTGPTGQEILKAFEDAALDWQGKNPGMTFAKAFADIYEDPANRELVKRERAANGFYAAPPIAKALPQVESLDPEIEQTMALDKLQAMAAEFRRSHPEYTEAQGFEKVYMANPDLQKRERDASRQRLANAYISAMTR